MDIAPALTVITQGFGCSSFPEYVCCGCPAYFHYGIDLSSGNASNQPQYATRPGTVNRAGPGVVPGQPGLGTAVIVSMDDGHDMLYGHFWSVAVQGGQRVNVGDVVGYTGSTGYSTGPHAHIEVRRRGNLNASPTGVVDPWPWLTFGKPEPPPPPARVAVGVDDMTRYMSVEREDVPGAVDIYVLLDNGQLVSILRGPPGEGYRGMSFPPGTWQALVDAGRYGGASYCTGLGVDGGLYQVVWGPSSGGWEGPQRLL